MAYESHELFRRIIEVLGAKRVARVLGLSVGNVYKLARHPMDEDNPDATGARNDLDRIEALADVLAAHPKARPVLRELRLWFDELFRRALDREEPAPLTNGALAHRVGRVVREFGEFLQECGPDLDPRRISREGMEAVEWIERLVRSAQNGVTQESVH